MTDLIRVTGITADGKIGVGTERDEPQPVVVDVEIIGDLAEAAAADTVTATIDYGAVCSEVREEITTQSYELIEALAEGVAARVIALGANAVRITVSKPRAAEALGVGSVSVVVER